MARSSPVETQNVKSPLSDSGTAGQTIGASMRSHPASAMPGTKANAPVATTSVSRPSNALPNAAKPTSTIDTGMVKKAAIDFRLSKFHPMVAAMTRA